MFDYNIVLKFSMISDIDNNYSCIKKNIDRVRKPGFL